MPENDVFKVYSLYAGNGDCCIVEYGPATHPHRVVVDCGPLGTSKNLQLMLNQHQTTYRNELLVISHVDADHIAGVLPLLKSSHFLQSFEHVWFNGRAHLNYVPGLETLGPVQGEKLSAALLKYKAGWNTLFKSQPVCISDDGTPVHRTLPGGASVIILSPGMSELRALRSIWDREIKAAGLTDEAPPQAPAAIDGLETLGSFDVNTLADTAFVEDVKKANGSSIAFLLEYQGRTVLMSADAFPSVLEKSLRKHYKDIPVQIDIFKVPHHGSSGNVSKELLQLVRCKIALFSSNGAVHHHPEAVAVARVIKYSPRGVQLVFNCRTQFNDIWDSDSLRDKWGYTTQYGEGVDGISINVDGGTG